MYPQTAVGNKGTHQRRPGEAVKMNGITLKDTRPPIGRQIETKGGTLEKSHELTQTAMGRTNSYLHHFEMGGTRYIEPRFLEWNGPLDPTEFDVKHATRRIREGVPA